jgi:GNAT superfamily N-acetyltransferase
MILALEVERAAKPAFSESVAFRWADHRDLDLLQSLGHSASTLEARLSQGDLPFVMLSDSELVGYVWFRAHLYDEESLGIRFRMTPNETWLYDAMVSKAWRGQGLYRGLLGAASFALRQKGVQRVWVAVETLNRNSVEAHRRAGAVPICTLGLVRVFGVTRLFGPRLSGVARWSFGRWPEIPASTLG